MGTNSVIHLPLLLLRHPETLTLALDWVDDATW